MHTTYASTFVWRSYHNPVIASHLLIVRTFIIAHAFVVVVAITYHTEPSSSEHTRSHRSYVRLQDVNA